MRWKSLLCFLLFTNAFINAFPQNKFVIEGKLPDHSRDGKYVYLHRPRLMFTEGGEMLVDSARIHNAGFSFSGFVDMPFMANVWLPYTSSTGIIIEPGVIAIDITAWDYSGTISGTPHNDEYNGVLEHERIYSEISIPISRCRDSLLKARVWTIVDESNYMQTVMKNKHLLLAMQRAELEFVESNAFEILSIESLLQSYCLENIRFDLIKDLLEKLPAEAREKIYREKQLYDQKMAEIEARGDDSGIPEPIDVFPEATKEGKGFIDFTGGTPEGEEMRLSEIHAGKKIVVLDFWASWCRPCMQEMPVIAEIYRKYKDKGLMIVGITSDRNTSDWKNAIRQYNLSWPQLISLEEGDKIGGIYGIERIPYTIVINGEGVIVSRGFRGEKLKVHIDSLMMPKGDVGQERVSR